MIYDVFTYNGEQDILEIRLNILNDYVDQFIIVEAPTTFSGKPKDLYYEKQKERFKEFWPKIKYFVIDENFTEDEINLAVSSPNTKGADHWKHEFLQKESIKKALTHLEDEDIVFIGDVDEIWSESNIEYETDLPEKLGLIVYTYWLNNKSSEEFWGTICSKYKYIKDECLNELRSSNFIRNPFKSGWHFTSMAGDLRRKLTDSYTEETYAHPAVMEQLDHNISHNKDFLGRDFTYTLDESEWPKWLTDNRDRYKHLIK